jgi:hypothetical protein
MRVRKEPLPMLIVNTVLGKPGSCGSSGVQKTRRNIPATTIGLSRPQTQSYICQPQLAEKQTAPDSKSDRSSPAQRGRE